MGCFDVYCFICGNPCHSILLDKKEHIREAFNDIFPDYNMKNSNIIDDIMGLVGKTKWMNKCTMLQINDKVTHGYKEMNCNNVFHNKNQTIEHLEWVDMDVLSENYGIFIHTDCWKYIKKKYGVELKFSNLPKIFSRTTNVKKIFDINYGEIIKYSQQDFNFFQIAIDKKTYICSSPLKNDKNISQISKNIHALKIHKMNDIKRKSPNVSATFYKEGEMKIGKNNNIWIVKNNKWVEIKEKVIKIKININKKNERILNNIPFFTRCNKNPIFIHSITKLKNEHSVEFILLESYKDVFINR